MFNKWHGKNIFPNHPSNVNCLKSSTQKEVSIKYTSKARSYNVNYYPLAELKVSIL